MFNGVRNHFLEMTPDPIKLLLFSCRKKDKKVPIVSTDAVSNITQISALSNVNIISDNGSAITL